MAYFDDPERLAQWEQELAALRVERDNRASGRTPARNAEPEAAAQLEETDELSSLRWKEEDMAQDIPNWQPDPPPHPLREAISYEQLEADMGLRREDTPTTRPEALQKTRERDAPAR